jgi:hypothetical protein
MIGFNNNEAFLLFRRLSFVIEFTGTSISAFISSKSLFSDDFSFNEVNDVFDFFIS